MNDQWSCIANWEAHKGAVSASCSVQDPKDENRILVFTASSDSTVKVWSYTLGQGQRNDLACLTSLNLVDRITCTGANYHAWIEIGVCFTGHSAAEQRSGTWSYKSALADYVCRFLIGILLALAMTDLAIYLYTFTTSNKVGYTSVRSSRAESRSDHSSSNQHPSPATPTGSAPSPFPTLYLHLPPPNHQTYY